MSKAHNLSHSIETDTGNGNKRGQAVAGIINALKSHLTVIILHVILIFSELVSPVKTLLHMQNAIYVQFELISRNT